MFIITLILLLGKIIKRKVKKKINRCTNIPKLFLQHLNDANTSIKSKAELKISENNMVQPIFEPTADVLDKKKKESKMFVSPTTRKKKNKIPPRKYKTKETSIRKHHKKWKADVVSPAKKKYKTAMKQKHTFNKQKKTKVSSNKFIYLGDIDSICKRSKIVAQKAEYFLQNTKRRSNINHLRNANSKRIETNMTLRKKYCAINENNISEPAITNKYIIEKYIMNKLKPKSYKTTYDLVETVLKSQQEVTNAAENNTSEELYRKFNKRNDTLRCVNMIPKRYALTNKYIYNEYSTNDDKKARVSHNKNKHPSQFKTCSEYDENFSEYLSFYGQKEIADIMTNVSEKLECINEENATYGEKHHTSIYGTRTETSYRTLSSPLMVLTYDSHQYHKNDAFTRNNTENFNTINKIQNIRFITKESRDNFITTNDNKNRFQIPYKIASNTQTKTFDIRMKQTIDESYTIEYSKSYENNYNAVYNYKNSQTEKYNATSRDFIKDNDYYKHTTVNYEPLSNFENTYTIHASHSLFDKHGTIENQITRNSQTFELLESYSVHDSHLEVNQVDNGSKPNEDDHTHNSRNNHNIVFVSKSQQHSETVPSDNMIVEPLNICETVFDEIGSGEKEFDISFNENNQLNDSLYGFIKDGIVGHVENEGLINQENVDTPEKISHHFSCVVKTIQPNKTDNNINDNLQDLTERKQDEIANIRPRNLLGLDLATERNVNTENKDCNFDINFNFKNRPRFMPKGNDNISTIFNFLDFRKD